MIGVALLILTAFTLWFSSAVLTRILGVRSVTATLLSWITIAYAQIILVSLTVSWPSALNEYSLAASHLLIAVIAALVWRRCARPRLGPEIGKTSRRFRIIVCSNWSISLLTAAVALAAGVNIFLILYVPPNSWDAMTCHLARAAFWMQYQRVGDFPSHNPLHNDYPMGASIAQMYTLVFIRSNLLPGFVQFGAWLGSFLCVYGIAREFGFRPVACVQAGFITLLLPTFILQATSTMIDLLFAMVAGLCVYFLLLALRTDRAGPLLLAAIGMGLLFAAKGTTPMLGPLFVTCLLGWSFMLSKRPIRFISRYCLAALLCVGLLGIESYVGNLLRYHALASPNHSPRSGRNDVQQLRANLIRFGVAAFALPFEQPYNFRPDARRIAAVRGLGDFLGVDVENRRHRRSLAIDDMYYRGIVEDSEWYGLVGFLLYSAACLFATEWLTLRPPEKLRRRIVGGVFAASVISAVGFSFPAAAALALLSAALVIRWRDPARPKAAVRWLLAANVVAVLLIGFAFLQFAAWLGRLFTPVVLFAGAITPAFYNPRRRAGRIIAGAVTILSIVQACSVMAYNSRKPLVPTESVAQVHPQKGTVFDLSRERRFAVARPEMADLARAVDNVQPSIRRLGYISGGGDSWDFPFFGDHLDREIVLINHQSDWLAEIESHKLDYVLLIKVSHNRPSGFRVLWHSQRAHAVLWARESAPGVLAKRPGE